jgi:hypothetical protein
MLFLHVGTFSPFIFHLPPTRIPRISHQRYIPSTLDLVLTNGFHEVCNLSTRTALSSDHLPVLFGLELNVRREVPEHFVFDYKNADWALFRREMVSRMNLNFSLDTEIDTLIRTFTEAGTAAVPLVRQSRFCLAISPQIKSIIAQKMAGGVCGRNSRNTQDILEVETLNNLFREL